MGLIKEYVRIRDDIKSIYHTPDDAHFVSGRLSRVPWKTAKDRNFFEVLYYLAYHGALSVNEMVGLSSQYKMPDAKNKYTIIYRILHGSDAKQMVGLESKGLVEIVAEGQIKKYGLTLLGIFFAIEVLFDLRAARRFTLDQIKTDRGFAGQPDTVIDALAKNYPEKIPHIFDTFDILKRHDSVDLNALYFIISGKRMTSSKLIEEGLVPYAKKEMQVTTLFYEGHLFAGFGDYEGNVKITPEVDRFVEKMYDDIKTIIEIDLLVIKRIISQRRKDGKVSTIQKKIDKLMAKTEPRIREGWELKDGKIFLLPEISDHPDVKKILNEISKKRSKN